MKVLFTVLSLWAVAVFALRGDRDQPRYRFTELADPQNVEHFRPGQAYIYQLDTQISSGMASVSDQHAITRLQSEVLLNFESERKVTLRLNDVIIGSLNHEIAQPERVQPMEMFRKNPIKREEMKMLELPCSFDYVEGLVENVRFHQDDQPWSKNIKKSVLNMLQMNLKQRIGAKVELQQPEQWKSDSEYETKIDSDSKMFVMPEITLEGECQTTYTLNKMSQQNRDNIKMFNVTKSIDFKQCRKIADIRYGPKVEKPCDNCTTPEELEEQKLDRTTVLRHVVVGTPEKYGILRVELVSQYLFKMLNVEEEKPMHTVVAGQLSYIKSEGNRRENDREIRAIANSKEETLLYSTEWDEQEKRFYMYGDEEFPQTSPFKMVQDKVGKIEKLVQKLINLWNDKKVGIETEATLVYSRIVEMLRMCTQEELHQIYSNFRQNGRSNKLSESESLKAEEIVMDAFANAGTYNTIKVLVEKILKREIPITRAVRALTQLKDLPAPSDKQVETLTQLCQNEICSRSGPCRQACWLTSGAIMGELCDEEITVEDALEQKKESLCQNDLKKKFIKQIMNQYQKVETRYEKVLLLKALGNAGVDLSVFELEKIIRNIREHPIIRMQAIDSLRRLRAVMPEKIQRVLMPVFQDIRERPEVRMACVYQILATVPEKHILDLIAHILIRDPSRQVKSYVYTAMKSLSESSVKMEKELSQHLKALLKLAGLSEEDEEVLLRGSRFYRFPVYSQARKEGLFLDLESMVGPDNYLPKHLHAGLDSFLNGIFKKSNMEISFTQDDIEKWYDNVINVVMDYINVDTSSKKALRGYRTSMQENRNVDDEEIRSIFSGLNIKRRSQRFEGDNDETPYGMFCFRMGDIDYAILPFDEELLAEPLKKIINGERPSMRDFEKLLEIVQNRPFRAHTGFNLIENSIKIPTSMGLPIRMHHVLPILASIEGQVKPHMSSSNLKVDIKLHPTVAVTHLKRIEVWTPIINTGVETTRTILLNLPVESKLTIKMESSPIKFEWSVQIPEHKFRLMSFQSLPLTFVSELEWMQQRTPVVRRIENQELIHRTRSVEQVYGHKNFDLPIKVTGEYHMPRTMAYKDIIDVLMTSENHINVEFVPSQETPREIVMIGEGQLFDQSSERTQHHQLKSFYSKSKFNQLEEDFEDDNEDDERKLNTYLEGYEPKKMYKHTAKIQIKTIGGRKEKTAQLEIQGACDEKMRFCRANVEAKRSPLFEETREWTMKTQIQTLLPESVFSVEQYKERSGKHQKFVCTIDTEWGTDRKQSINVNVNGEQIRNKYWVEKINEIEKYNQPKLREQMKQKVAFLNKYDISAQYQHVEPSTINFFSWASTVLKSWNFWNTQVELKENRERQILATVVIDPFTHEHVNVTVKTPKEIIRIQSLGLPMKVKPFKLVRNFESSVESVSDLFREYTSESRQECKVDSRKVRTFDDVTFKAPITKCYTVLAKDCKSERPRFAVFMKKINSQDKKLKMVSGSDVFEVEPVSENSDKLKVMINGRQVEDYETLREYNIELNKDNVRINTEDVTVRFDGEKAWVKVSSYYKNSQCGLCGNYNDDTNDEYRTSDNELTADIKAFHKSYSYQDNECREDLEDSYRKQEYEPITESREYYERDEEYEEKRRRTNDNDETEPIEKTEVIEHSHKICFSIKPVKTCPEGFYPSETKEQKTSFTCLDRTSTEARRLLRQARRLNEPIEVPSQKASFVQSLTVPTTCVVY